MHFGNTFRGFIYLTLNDINMKLRQENRTKSSRF